MPDQHNQRIARLFGGCVRSPNQRAADSAPLTVGGDRQRGKYQLFRVSDADFRQHNMPDDDFVLFGD